MIKANKKSGNFLKNEKIFKIGIDKRKFSVIIKVQIRITY